jgi:hypothetical protein
MAQRIRMLWLSGFGVLILALWFALPMLMPEMALTQRPREFSEISADSEWPLSRVGLEVEVPLAELERRLAQDIDASLARERKDRDFRAWRSGALRLQQKGRALLLTLPLSFKSSAGPDTKGSLVVQTAIVADIAPDWRPRVDVVSRFSWTRRPRIRLLGVKLRVSGVIGRAISDKLRDLDTDLKAKIEAALTLKPRAQDWWRDLHQPRLLNEDPPVWLSVVPDSMYFEPPGANDRMLRLMLGVRARFSTSVAANPAPTPAVPLPDLERASAAADRGFVLILPVLADYGGLTAKLHDKLVGRRIGLDRGTVTPTDFTLYTSGRNLVVGVGFRGDAPGFLLDTRGTVYFTGEPNFDPQTRVLRIDNFRFTRRLNNPLLTTASWVLQDSLREQMQQRLVWDLGERLQHGAHALSAQLNKSLGNDLQLKGEVMRLNLTGVECLAEGIRIGLEVRGRLRVVMAETTPASTHPQRGDQQAQPAGGETQAAQRRNRPQPFPAEQRKPVQTAAE